MKNNIVIQIYEVQTASEAEKLIELGVDHIGSVIVSEREWRIPIISETINLLENEGGLNVYLPDNYNWITLESKKENFDKFVDKRNINMIYYSISLNNSVQLKRDSTWSEFLINPDTFGFQKLIKNSGGIIYLRKDIKLN